MAIPETAVCSLLRGGGGEDGHLQQDFQSDSPSFSPVQFLSSAMSAFVVSFLDGSRGDLGEKQRRARKICILLIFKDIEHLFN